MESQKFSLYLCILIFALSNYILPQSTVSLGLENQKITSMKMGYGNIAAGTNGNGVYWQNEFALPDSGWKKIELKNVNVRSVYPHKSGPIGWAIGIGTAPSISDSEFVYCSFLGETPKPMSYGIDKEFTGEILRIDGFPDPTICGETFALGGSILYRRFFNDTTWHSVYQAYEGGFATLKARERFAYVYAGGSEGFSGMMLIRSADKGDSWEHLFPGITVLRVDFWGDDEHQIIVSDVSSVRLTSNDGLDWDEIFVTDSLFIQSLSFANEGKRIVLAANTKYYDYPRVYLFISDDNGNSWEKITPEINDIIVDMEIGSKESIYLATIMSGIFKIELPVVQVEEQKYQNVITHFMLAQNYPNPFNTNTKINYSIPQRSYVTLKVFDVLGREVAWLINKEQNSGSYEVQFDASNLTSGIYFYKLQAGNFVNTKKMVSLK